MCFVTRVAELTKLTREELLEQADRLVEQNQILHATSQRRTERIHELEVRIKALRLLLLLARDNLRPGPKSEPILEALDDAYAKTASDRVNVEYPDLGFADQVSGVERDKHGRVRASEPDDPWTPPFDELTPEQAAAYIDAEIRLVAGSASFRVAWWTQELDDFNQAMPLQLLENGRYRELWEYAASMRTDPH
jgi:hypothetical protein